MSGVHSFVSTTQPSHVFSPFIFVFHINVVLLGLFALYVVLTIPRALVYLFQPSEVSNGFFLRTGSSTASNRDDRVLRSGTNRGNKPLRSTSARTNQTAHTLVEKPGDAAYGGGDNGKSPSGSVAPPALIIPQLAVKHFSRRHVAAPRRLPTRVPRWATIVHPMIAYALDYRVAPGFSLGKLFILLAYAVIVLYSILFRSDPFNDPLRMGFVAMSQIPIAVALAGKTNVLSWVCGVGYQKVWTSSSGRAASH